MSEVSSPLIPIVRSQESKTKLLIIIVAIILGLGGGGFWYVKVYWSGQYAKAVLALDEEMRLFGSQQRQPQFRWRYDYETATNALDNYESFFIQFGKKAENLNPPLFDKEAQDLKENILFIIVEMPKGISNAKKVMAFVKEAIEVYRIYHPESSTIRETLPPELRSSQASTPLSFSGKDLGYLFDRWKLMLADAKQHTDKMFNQELLNLGDVSFTELKSLWEEIYNASQTALPAIEKKFGRNFSINSLPSPAELEITIPGSTSLDRLDTFLSELENVIIRGDAERIVQSALYSQSPDFPDRSQRINESLKKLKGKYGKQ